MGIEGENGLDPQILHHNEGDAIYQAKPAAGCGEEAGHSRPMGGLIHCSVGNFVV